ncbi:hypothetical protein BV96_00699 [Sphingomonas paucimobilis]|nr:hypothetical protein BV96_00699 [Sphingomonas paucimobilis]
MTMLPSLKALLFSSTPLGTAAAQPATPGETSDFAALLDGSMEEVSSAPPAALPTGEEAPDVTVDAAPADDQRPAPRPDDHVPPGLALGLIKHVPEPVPAQPAEGEAEAEPAALPAAQVPQPSSDPAADVEQAVAAAKPLPAKAEPKLETAETPATEGTPAPEAKPAWKEKAKAEWPQHDIDAAAPAPQPLSAAAIIAEPPIVPAAAGPEPSKDVEPPIAAAIPPPAAGGAAPAPQPLDPALPPQQANPAPAQENAAAESGLEPPRAAADQPRAIGTDQEASNPGTAQPAAPVLHGKPVKAEALALLQMVREQVAARQTGASPHVGEQVSALANAKGETPAPNADPAPEIPAASISPGATPSVPAATAPLTAGAQAAPSPSMPVADLSASLGAQVVDMGVSGQWIDGLARDIAGLSANGAQGRFQINGDQLGTVQVDIRQGADGAAVSLTVASEAAEMALRQDSDRLKLDAGLSAVRIAEVRVERAHVAEAARSDMGGDSSQRQPSQQQQGSQTASSWAQNGGQNMGQPQGQQGRWQTRENSAFSPKSSGDPAVLNHAEARQDASGAVRARYA